MTNVETIKINSYLHKAAKENDIEYIFQSYRQGRPIDMKDMHGRTILHIAVQHRLSHLVDLCINEFGIDIFERLVINNRSFSCFDLAVVSNNVEIFKLLYDCGLKRQGAHGCDHNDNEFKNLYNDAMLSTTENFHCMTYTLNVVLIEAFHLAAKLGYHTFVRSHLQSYLPINARNRNGQNILYPAVAFCTEDSLPPIYIDLIPVLANCSESLITTPLFEAISQKKIALSIYLINSGCDIRQRCCFGHSMHAAVAVGSLNMTMYLVGMWADMIGILNDTDSTFINDRTGPLDEVCVECTPLMQAIIYGHTDIACYLIQIGACVDLQDAYGRTALHHAVMHDNIKVSGILLKKCANSKLKDRNGCTATDLARASGRHMIDLFASNGLLQDASIFKKHQSDAFYGGDPAPDFWDNYILHARHMG